jgi:fructokinase
MAHNVNMRSSLRTSPRVDVAGTGFTVLDRVYTGDSPLEALGGSCGNVLVSLAMLNRSVAPIIALGRDAVGDRLVSTFVEAGANVRYIARKQGIASPVLAQQLDLVSGRHWFAAVCPDTHVEFPRYTSISPSDVRQAREVINHCRVFYVDRVSAPIVDAMETAAGNGALVYFEPSAIDDTALFERALRVTKVLKYSSDRLSDAVSAWLDLDAISIVTHGADGLELRQGAMSYWCDAIDADVVRDTCGSGDMVSVGLIDWLLSCHSAYRPWNIEAVLAGVVAGQRLAAINCAYAGARGLFEQRGAAVARAILDGV